MSERARARPSATPPPVSAAAAHGARELPEVVYTPESEVRSPLRLLRDMARDLVAGRELAWRLFVRDVSALYRRSLLGIVWGFLPPLVTGLIFIVLHNRSVVDVGRTPIPYPAFVLIGTILWQTFVEAVHAPLKAVNNARAMLAKINFPREALILAAFYEVLFNFALKAIVLVGVFVWFDIRPTPGLALAPLALLALIGLGMMIGLCLTPVGILYTDVGSGLLVVTQLWFFVTPVVYPVPTSFPFSLIGVLNPVSPLLVATRDLMTLGVLTHPLAFTVVTALTVAGIVLGAIVYRVAMPILVERMSS